MEGAVRSGREAARALVAALPQRERVTGSTRGSARAAQVGDGGGA
jgi:hypothetical protein